MAGASYRLFGRAGSGSMVIEAALRLAGAGVEYVDVEWEALGWGKGPHPEANPLGQIPVLELPDGTIMTESAAMILHIADRYPSAGLAPAVGHVERDAFLRGLMFVAASVYSVFAYADVPERWVDGDARAAGAFKARTVEHLQRLYAYLDRNARSPWFLGDTFTALDLYIWIMRYWRPGPAWFEASAPKLHAIGERAATLPSVRAVQARNFPEAAPGA